MFKQIRSMLADETSAPLGGKRGGGVEIDETYIGGRRRGYYGRSSGGLKDKVPVIGLVERKGRVIALAAPDTKKVTVMDIIKEKVLPQSTVFTDDYVIYDDLGCHRNEYSHHRIRHSAKVYVMGNTHTNSIEGFGA